MVNFDVPPKNQYSRTCRGVYPQSDGSLAIVDIDASKGFVALWVHLTFAIFAIFDVKSQLKLLEMACNQVQTCLIFPLRWAGFLIIIGRIAQWEHLFFMYIDDILTICLTFQSKSPFSMIKMISQWEHHISAITCNEGIRCNSTRI